MTPNPKRGRLRPLLSGVLLRTQTDERLAALAAIGNQQAFSVIYERYRRELASHACRIVRPDRADDVVQHAMLAAWSAILSGAEISDLRAWLHRVTQNAALDTIGRRGYDDTGIPDSSIAPSGTEELAEGRLGAASALAALAALPDSQRRALTLTAIEGRSGQDAASEMGISESAMRQLVYRARSRVRSVVTALTPVPLVDWVIAATGAPATPVALSLGAAGGGAGTVAKAVAVLGAAAAASLGATHALQTSHPSRHSRITPTHTAALTTADRGTPATGQRFGTGPVSPAPAPAKYSPARRLVSEQPPNRAPAAGARPVSAAGQSSGDQSRSGTPSGGGGDRQSGPGRQSGAPQHHSPEPSDAGGGPQPRQSGHGENGSSSGQSGAASSPAPPSGQSDGAPSSPNPPVDTGSQHDALDSAGSVSDAPTTAPAAAAPSESQGGNT